MKRREFITLLGGTAAAWSANARAQQQFERMGRIGVLMNLSADDPEISRPRRCVSGEPAGSGLDRRTQYPDGRPLGPGNFGDNRKYAAELVALAPDAILASTTVALGPLLELTRTIPIVFVNATDPVGGGYVESLARPGGNATGFLLFEYSMSAKWLELLKEIAPRLSRVAVLRDPTIAAGTGQFGAIQAVAPALGVELHPLNIRDASEIERALGAFARGANGGLIVTASTLASLHRELIVTLAARHKLPAIYFFRFFVARGGLISYGPNPIDPYRRAASYVDRILKGEKPADLPVQAATKYELAINLKTAKVLGLEIPATVLARADEVIE